jgi:regulator of protease activity HflC (stomatin/prohibitin superfamily)
MKRNSDPTPMPPKKKMNKFLIKLGIAGLILFLIPVIFYSFIRIDVPAEHIAILTKKTGEDIENDQVFAPNSDYKGVQLNVLGEGRHFLNPYVWSWHVYPMITIPSGKLGVRIRQYGDNLPYGHFLATKENQKGIIPEVLRPGRYQINGVIKGQEEKRPINNYSEIIELYDPITIPAGFSGVVTNLAGPIPENPNTLVVENGFRGVQKDSLDSGTYYLNPYLMKVNVVDCRSQRYNLYDEKNKKEISFPSKDGFLISLDGVIEFRIDPKKASRVFAIYNETENDNVNESSIHEELVKKVITPNARSFCRLKGSNKSGRDFIGGDTRIEFQKDFQTAMAESCSIEGIEIVQALITKINPPQAIAKPVREREVAHQKQQQYIEQQKQQQSEANLAKEKSLIQQRQELVGADTKVIQKTTAAEQAQKVAVTKAKQELAVAMKDLETAKDKAAAVISEKKGEAGVIDFQNIAEAAGWKVAIDALGGDGEAYAKYVLYQKIAPSFKSLMINTADSPLVKILENIQKEKIPVKK